MKKLSFLFLLIFQLLNSHAHGDIVVGLHGFLDCWRSLEPAKRVLEGRGLKVYLWHFPSRKKYIEEHGADLVQFLQRLSCDYPGEPIHFVTHSVGALVVRAAVNNPCCPDQAKIGRAVLIAPPNQGSQLARRFQNFLPVVWAMGNKSGWELMHYEPCEIAAFGEFPCTMDVLVISGTLGTRVWFKTTNDGFLTLEETWLNTPFTSLNYCFSHGDLVKKPIVLKNMRDFICEGTCDAASGE